MVELVVKIAEEIYQEAIKYGYSHLYDEEAANAVLNGIPLPKGHGRLIDVDELDVTTITTDDYSGNEVLDVVLKEDIDDAPTIIEADNESEG